MKVRRPAWFVISPASRKIFPASPIWFFPNDARLFRARLFWHRHSDSNCKLARLPKSRLSFGAPNWRAIDCAILKITRNLRSWMASLVLWECELRDISEACGKKSGTFWKMNEESRVIELFAGAGGLAWALVTRVFERPPPGLNGIVNVDTIRENQSRGTKPICQWL